MRTKRLQSLMLFGVCSMFGPWSVTAETLEEMVPWAKKYDARYLAARADYDATDFRVDQARSKLFPSLNASARAARNTLDITYDDPGFRELNRNFNSQDFSAQLVQPLFRLESWSGLAVSGRVRKQSFFSLRQAESDLILRLAHAYYDVLLAKENLIVLEAEKRALSERLAAAEGLNRSGAVARIEPMQVQSDLSLVVADLLEAQWQLANKRRVLESIVGSQVLDPEPMGETAIEKELGDLDDWLQRASENPQVRAAKMSLEAAKQEELRAHSGFWPEVDAIGTYQRAQLGPSAAVPVNTRNRNTSAEVRLTWGLFSGGGTLAEYRESKKKKEKAQSDLLAVEREVSIQIAEAYSGVHSGFEQLKALNQGVSASEEVVRAMEKGFGAGARTLAQILDSREEWVEAKRTRSETFYKLLLNQIKLHLMVGELDFLDY